MAAAGRMMAQELTNWGCDSSRRSACPIKFYVAHPEDSRMTSNGRAGEGSGDGASGRGGECTFCENNQTAGQQREDTGTFRRLAGRFPTKLGTTGSDEPARGCPLLDDFRPEEGP